MRVNEIDRLKAANEAFVAARANESDAVPSRRLAVVTCMDARIDAFNALGLRVGEAHVIRNAGARVTNDVLRSLALSVNVLEVNAVVIMQHTGCGVAGVDNEQLQRVTGAEFDFLPISDHAEALARDVDAVASAKFLSGISVVAGFVYDVATGQLDEVVRREQP